MATQDDAEPTTPEPPQQPSVAAAIGKKRLLWIAGITLAVWAFTLQTGSTVLLIIVGTLTGALAVALLWAWRQISKHRKLGTLLHGAVSSPEARQKALAELASSKDAGSPTHVFARAQLLAAEDPKAALELLRPVELKSFPPAMQDDVSLLRTQLYLGLGRTADARKSADLINLDNPQRKDMRALTASIVAEAWARTGKPKEAIALLDTIALPKKDGDQIALQMRVARVFARFAANQRNAARTELVALADEDPQHLGRFVAPQFRVHPELQKLARRVFEQHPSARKMMKVQAKQQR